MKMSHNKNKAPLISVIIPIYKTEKFLHKCLDSILSQTYTHWEAILVDDGSPDNCGAICDEYVAKDNRFKVIHQVNSGVVKARNNAIAIAQGCYLAFVDSDDFIESNMFEIMVTLATEKGLDIVWCNLKRIHQNNEELENIKIYNDNTTNIKMLIRGAIPGYLCNKLISKPFWDKCNVKTDEKAVMWEDTYISLQLLGNNPQMSLIDNPLYNYNQTNENSATAQVDTTITHAEKNIINIHNYLIQSNLYKSYFDEFSQLALRLKIALLSKDTNKAFSIFPFAHKRFRNYNLSFLANIFYFFAFNSGWFGKKLFEYYFKYKNNR